MKFGNMSAEQMIAAADVTEAERAELRELLGGVYAATGIARGIAEKRFAARVQQIARGRSGRGASRPAGRSVTDAKLAKKAAKRARRAAEAAALGMTPDEYRAHRAQVNSAKAAALIATSTAFAAPVIRDAALSNGVAPSRVMSLEAARRRAGTVGLRLSSDPRHPGAVVDTDDNVVQMPPPRRD